MEKLLRGTAAFKIFCGDRVSDRLSHAYLLDFADAANMRKALKLFAREFFGAADGTTLCHRIESESFTDFKLYPEEGKKLNADAINEIIADGALKPVEGDKKLFAISGFESAAPILQNKLLKSLEEPAAGVYFLLGAASLSPVLDTVKSRVRILTVPPFSEEQIFSALERKGHNPLNAEAAKSADGVFGLAENIVGGGWFGEISAAADEICSVRSIGEIGAVAIKYGDTKYREELLREVRRKYFNQLKEGGGFLEKPALIRAQELLSSAFENLKFNANFQGLLYDFLLEVIKENEKWRQLLR